MKYYCRCKHPLGKHVKSEKDDSILECTYNECPCEEYEEQQNDADVWPDEQSIEDYERNIGMDSEYLENEDKEIYEELKKHPPFVDKLSDDETKNLK